MEFVSKNCNFMFFGTKTYGKCNAAKDKDELINRKFLIKIELKVQIHTNKTCQL